jgi:hypothetical protein
MACARNWAIAQNAAKRRLRMGLMDGKAACVTGVPVDAGSCLK